MTDYEINEFELAGHFRLRTPPNWHVDMSNEVGLCRICCENGTGSGVFIGASKVCWAANELPEKLLESTQNFINNAIIPVEVVSISDIQTETIGKSIADTFVLLNNGNNWLIRFVFDERKGLVYIVHFNGPADEAYQILSGIKSFESI